MVPTITTLLKVAGALGRPVAYFVDEEEGPPSPTVFIRDGEQPADLHLAHRHRPGRHQRRRTAGSSSPARRPRSSPAPAAATRPMEHPGEELVYLLEGELEFDVDGADLHLLGPGDSLHFRTDRPHRWRNPGRQPASALWMALRPM